MGGLEDTTGEPISRATLQSPLDKARFAAQDATMADSKDDFNQAQTSFVPLSVKRRVEATPTPAPAPEPARAPPPSVPSGSPRLSPFQGHELPTDSVAFRLDWRRERVLYGVIATQSLIIVALLLALAMR